MIPVSAMPQAYGEPVGQHSNQNVSDGLEPILSS
jgi:hypothetical protein